MHHVALNGPRPDDRHLDHQVIEGARPHPGQEIHLRPALHLKDAQTVGLAQHVIGRRVLGRQGGEVEPLVAMRLDQVQRLADAAQHPQRQDVDLQDLQAVDVVLVPGNDRAVLHRGVLHRAQLVQPPLGDDEAPHMLRQVARETLDLVDQGQRQRRRRSSGSSPISRRRASVMPLGPPKPQIWLDMADSTSSDRPMARPTSRTARLPR